MKPRHFLSALLLGVVLYPLSLGPVVLIASKLSGESLVSFMRLLSSVYRPLDLLGNHFPTFGNWTGWYVNLWVSLGDS